MKYRLAAALALGFIASPLAQASETIAVLDVHHAGCVLCGPIVKQTLEHVKGVKAVQVAQANGNADVTATVTFDNTVTNVANLINATTKVGFPADVASAN